MRTLDSLGPLGARVTLWALDALRALNPLRTLRSPAVRGREERVPVDILARVVDAVHVRVPAGVPGRSLRALGSGIALDPLSSLGSGVTLRALDSLGPLRAWVTLWALYPLRALRPGGSLGTDAVQDVDDEVPVPVLRRQIAHAVPVQVPAGEAIRSVRASRSCRPLRSGVPLQSLGTLGSGLSLLPRRSRRPCDASGSRERGGQDKRNSREQYRDDTQPLAHASRSRRG